MQCCVFWGIIIVMLKTFVSTSVLETEQIAEEFARGLTGGETVLLNGEMGAGKTHFTKGIAKGLDIADVITSPTFTLHNIYYGRLTLNHFDFYRIEDFSEAEMLGLDEFFYDKRGVSVIEWSENIKPLIPANHIVVTIEKLSDLQRKITLNG